MSWEGYCQILCEKGHYRTQDGFSDPDDDPCPICNEKTRWYNVVDQTNGSFDYNPISDKQERIDGYIDLEIDVPAKVCKCSGCGNEHKISFETYKIPVSNKVRGNLIK